MRRFAMIIGGVLGVIALVVIGGLVYLQTLDLNRYKDEIAAKVSQKTGRALRIDGPVDLVVSLTPAIALQDLRFANASWGRAADMVRVGRAEAEIDLISLFFGTPRLTRLLLEDTEVLLERRADGRPNWALGQGGGRGEARRGTAPAQAPGEAVRIPDFSDVTLRNIRLRYVGDDGTSGTDLAIDRLVLKAAAPDTPVRLDVALRLGGLPMSLAGEVGPLTALQNDHGLTVDLAGNVGPMQVVVSGDVEEPLAGRGIGLGLRLEADQLAALGQAFGVAGLPPVGPVALRGRLAGNIETLGLQDLDLRLGAARLQGRVDVDRRNLRPVVIADLVGDRLDLTPLLATTPAAPATPAARAPVGAGDDRVIPVVQFPWGYLTRLDGRVSLAGAALQIDDTVIEDVKLTADLTAGKLTLNPLAASAFGARLQVTGTIDGARVPGAVALQARWTDFDLGGMLRHFGLTDLYAGRARIDADLSARGSDLRALAATLDGRLEVVAEEGRIDSGLIDLLSADLVSGVLPWVQGNRTAVNCFVARFDIAAGVARGDGILFDTRRATIKGEGQVDLGREGLDLRVIPRAKEAGLVDITFPVDVTGTFAAPRIAPTPAAVLKGVMGLALTAVNPAAALVPLVTPGSSEKNPCLTALSQPADSEPAAPAAAVDPVEAIGGALKGLFGQ